MPLLHSRQPHVLSVLATLGSAGLWWACLPLTIGAPMAYSKISPQLPDHPAHAFASNAYTLSLLGGPFAVALAALFSIAGWIAWALKRYALGRPLGWAASGVSTLPTLTLLVALAAQAIGP